MRMDVPRAYLAAIGKRGGLTGGKSRSEKKLKAAAANLARANAVLSKRRRERMEGAATGRKPGAGPRRGDFRQGGPRHALDATEARSEFDRAAGPPDFRPRCPEVES